MEKSQGAFYSPQMNENLEFCKGLVAKNKPVVIVIDGGLGEGKTTLAVECADWINGKAYPFAELLGMGGQEFIKIFDAEKIKKSCVIYDEAGDYGRRGAMTKFNRDLGRIFETFRAFKVIVLIVLPRFWWLDSKIYELGVVQMIIHCYGRKQNYGRYSVWFPDTLDWLLSRSQKLRKLGLPQKLCYGGVSPNQRGLFRDLSVERSRQLTKYGLQGKEMISQESVFSSQGLMSLKQICFKTGRSYQWVQRALRANKVRPENKWKNRHYYRMSVVDALLDQIHNG